MLDRDEILRKTREIALSVLRNNAAEVDREHKWPAESIRALQAQGLAGLVVPFSAGGLGQGLLALVQVCEILGEECASSAMCFGMHCVGSAVIAAKATDDQTKRFLIPIAQGEHITTLALSEPGTGSHFYIPQTTLKPAHGVLEINGTKSFVTNGSQADSYVISTVAEDPHAPPGEFSMIILPKDSKGIHWQQVWSGFGMRGNSSRDVKLDDVKLAEANLLGEKGDEIWYVFEIVAPYFLMAMAGTYLGVAEAALQEVTTHLKERSYSHTGGSLSSVSILQHRFGTLWSRLQSARQLVYHAAALADEKSPEALSSVLSAKAEVADVAVYVVNEALSLLGGKGFAKDGKAGRLLRDVRAAQVMAPTTDMLRTWAGRALLGLPLLSED